MVADRPGRHRITLGANKAYDVADRLVPNLVIQRQPDKPAEQQIVVELLHHLLLRTHRVEGLQQQDAKQSLGGNRKRLVHNPLDRPPWMIFGNSRLAAHTARRSSYPDRASDVPHISSRSPDYTQYLDQ